MDIQRLDHQSSRIETGLVQFGDDHPGLFIRGDEAAYLALVLGNTLAHPAVVDTFGDARLSWNQLERLHGLLNSVNRGA